MYTKRLLKRRLDVHVCELPQTSESNLPKLPPNAKFYAHWRRNFQKLILVSVNHPLIRNFLRSYAAVAFEKRRHGRSSFWWVIHPCSELRFYWDLLMTFIFLYLFIAVPYLLAFHRVAKSSGPESLNPLYPAYIVCILDIVLNFITGFTSSNRHEIFLDPVLITRHYARGYFIIDFVSSVPYVWFYRYRILYPGPDSNSIFLIPEFLLLFKLFRIYTLRFYVKQIITSFSVSHATEKTIWLALLMLLMFHWCSCVSHAFPIVVAHVYGETMKDLGMYLCTAELYKRNDLEIYLMYFHIGISNFFGSSFIEFYSFSKVDTVIRCILLLIGRGFMFYFMVMILQFLESAVEPELKYERIMHQVKEYIYEKKLPERLKDKLLAYYEYRFQGSYFKEKAISSTLSEHLNQEIIIHSSRGLLDTATILHYLPRNVIGNLMGILKQVIYLNEDIIYKSETEGDCMFFIISGSLESPCQFLVDDTGLNVSEWLKTNKMCMNFPDNPILLEKEKDMISFYCKICHEKDGGYFGEGALIFPEQRRLETVMALEVCELLRLNRRDFKRMFSLTSTFYRRLEKVARERREKIINLNSSHEKIINLNSSHEKIRSENNEAINETPDGAENNHQKRDGLNAD